MKRSRNRAALGICFGILALVLSACKPWPVEPTPTPRPTRAAVTAVPTTPTATREPAAPPDPVAISRGQIVFTGVGQCSICHTVDGSGNSVGPDLRGIAAKLEAQGIDAAAYLHESIVDVLASVPDGYNPDLMPRNYSDLLTPEQIDDLVDYMRSL